MGLCKVLFNFSDDLNYEGIWCSGEGPGTKYSTGNHMFLFFTCSGQITLRGFEFIISGILKEIIFILKHQTIYQVLLIERYVCKIFRGCCPHIYIL